MTFPYFILNLIDMLAGLFLVYKLQILHIFFIIFTIKTVIYFILSIRYLFSLLGLLTMLDMFAVISYYLNIEFLILSLGSYLVLKAILASF